MTPVILLILDGWGIAPPGPGNAVTLASTPNFDGLWANYPQTQLQTSGEAVGLPRGEDGNSEAGHLNLGAGRIVYQTLPRIDLAVADGSFIKNPAFLSAARHIKEQNSTLHLIGLIGSGVVHSSLEHLYTLLWFCKEQGLEKERVKLHLFTDGRDSPPESAALYLAEIIHKMGETGIGEIVSISGRYYAMDRDKRWERTEKAYRAIAEGKGERADSAFEAVEKSYGRGKSDEYILPTVIGGPVSENDAVIFFNFREDRARQLTKAFVDPTFEPFERKILKNLFFVTMTEYEEGLPVSATAFLPEKVDLPLARILSERNLRQLHIAETEKYPHVTYYFNGGREDPFPGEDRVLIPSPKVATYDLKPEMSAFEVTEVLLKRIGLEVYNFIIVNYANPDMVGHTGVLEAGIKAVEVVDQCLGQVVKAVLAMGGVCLITADHGNVEEMIDPRTGEVDTKHSTYPVPFIAVGKREEGRGKRGLTAGVLADVAPTVLGLLKIPKPSVLTGRNLLA